MTKRLKIILILTLVVVLAVCGIVIPGKIKQQKMAETQHVDPAKVQFCIDMKIGITLTPQPDGTIDYTIPIGLHYDDQYDVQYTTVNTKDLPAKILIRVNEELFYELTIKLADGNITLQSEEVSL